MSTLSLSQLGSGGAFNPSTDVVPVVRNGGGPSHPDVLTTLGTAATMAASAPGDTTVASVTGAITAGHIAAFADTVGTVEDGGVLGNAAHATASSGTGTLAAVNGGTAATHIAVFNDSAGTIHDTGLTSASFDAAGAAATAQSNAEAYASDASNLSSGTVASTLLPLCSPSVFGACKVDNTTITESGGVISAAPASAGVSSFNTLTGAVTISAGSNITLTPSGNNIAIASTGGGGGITVQNSNVPYASAITLVQATFTNVTSLSLVAGTYELTGNVYVHDTTGFLGQLRVGISQVSATMPDNSLISDMQYGTGGAGGEFGAWGMNAPSQVITISSTTTVYLVTLYNDDGSGVVTACGNLTAKKIG